MAVQSALRWVAIGGVFALPFIVFIVAQSLFFPFITGKNFAFRILVEVVAGAWIALALTDPAYRPRKSWILFAFAAFVALLGIADALGAYPAKSFWSNYERMDGWVTLAHLLAYLVAAVSVLNTEKLWRRLWEVSLAISSLVAILSLMQLVGAMALGQGGTAGLTARLDATFGNPIYLAAYMLFHVFIAALLLHQTGKDRWSSAERIVVSGIVAISVAVVASNVKGSAWLPYAMLLLVDGLAVYLLMKTRAYLLSFILALDVLVLFSTGTRGTMLGLFGGVALGALLYATSSSSVKIWKWIGIGALALVIAGTGLFLARNTAFVQGIGFLNRLSTISINDATVQARFLNWGMAWEGVKERPLLGWGQENYALVFDKYYDPRMYGAEQWFDRVHNSIFDWLVAGGFLGLIAYLSIFGAAFAALWRPAFTPIERSIFAGLLAAYFFHNLFVFDNISSYLLFATTLGYIAWRASQSAAPILRASLLPIRTLPIVAIVAVIGVWGVAYAVNAKALATNRFLLQAIAPQQEGLTKNLEYFKKALAQNSYGSQEIREQLVQGTAQLSNAQGVPNELKKQFLDLAISEMQKQAEDSPLDARPPLFLGVLLGAYGDDAGALAALQRALSLSPKKQTIMYEIAAAQLAQGQVDAALATYKQAFELLEENVDARLYYAAAAIRFGEAQLADELLAPVIPTGRAADSRITAAYAQAGRYDKIAVIWEARVQTDPQDVQARFTLAAAYYGQGDSARAISALEEIGRLFPDAKSQADSLISDIRSGKPVL
ncbi:MAG: O-antigen ligase family protein [Candidatus Kaiserbacteria bacterium]|nr:MAG: O-antigen ligase family protein [Candidatus Kaiserbacteria bacterium]